jgi:hypothetical protein
MSDLIWKKSSYSGGQSSACIEIAALPGGGRAVRDSKNPDGTVLLLTPGQWTALMKMVLPLSMEN